MHPAGPAMAVAALTLLFTVIDREPALAAPTTFTVNSTADDDDGFCDPLPEDCTLREAINAANANAGTDTIDFALGAGTPTISVGPGGLPLVTDAVAIRGNTGGATRVELDGSGAGQGANGLVLAFASSGSEIRGTVINRFNSFGVLVSSSSNHLIAGNYLGTDKTGTTFGPGQQFGVFVVDGGGNTIGGASVSERNVISGNGFGIVIAGAGSSGNGVSGNYIGTDATATNAVANSNDGIQITDVATGNVIGGTLPGTFNVISGNTLDGISISNASNANSVLGNFIGTNPAGSTSLGNGGAGVHILGGSGNNVLGNSIAFNGGLGIDLDPAGVTPNDLFDADIGPNGLQNFPELKGVKLQPGGASVVIRGLLRSLPNASFTVQFFVSAGCDPTGFGEGGILIGQIVVSTGPAGGVNFSPVFPVPVPVGLVITATATHSGGDTSEFSACQTVH